MYVSICLKFHSSDAESGPPTLSTYKKKKKSKKKSKERDRSKESRTPPILEPIEVQCEPVSSEFEEVSVKISPVLSSNEVSPRPRKDKVNSRDSSLTPLSTTATSIRK